MIADWNIYIKVGIHYTNTIGTMLNTIRTEKTEKYV